MNKIEFKDLPDTTTPFTASLFNEMQDNIEEAINEVQSNLDTANIYSTEEVNTGKIWINGKPIYRKIIEKQSIISNSDNSINHNISNLDELVSINGYLQIENQRYLLPRPAVGSLDYYVGVTLDNTAIKFVTGADANFSKALVIVEYTKTTD